MIAVVILISTLLSISHMKNIYNVQNQIQMYYFVLYHIRFYQTGAEREIKYVVYMFIFGFLTIGFNNAPRYYNVALRTILL